MRQKLWSGPIGALLGTDEDYEAAKRVVENFALHKNPQRLLEQIVAERVAVREENERSHRDSA